MIIKNNSHNNLIRRLQDFSITTPANSFSQNAIANKLLEFIFQEEIVQYNLEELAFYCNASTATFSRFIKELGYVNYKTFKQIIIGFQEERQEITINHDFSVEAHHQNVATHIAQTATLLEQQNLDVIIDALCSKNTIYLFGIHYSEMLLKELQYNLLKIGKRVFWSEGYVNQIEALNNIEENSICFFFSFNGYFIQSALPLLLATDKEYTSFLATSKSNQKYSNFFDETIYLSLDASDSSKTYQLQFFTDVLLERMKIQLLQSAEDEI